MGEIDDAYQEQVEVLDQKFLESVSAGGNSARLLEGYRKQLEAHRKLFEQRYASQLRAEKLAVLHRKISKHKGDSFSHLEVEHFDFTFSRMERFRMKFSLLWFRWSRSYHRFLSWITPAWMLYLLCFLGIHLKRMKQFFFDGVHDLVTGTHKRTIAVLSALAVGTVSFGKYLLSRVILFFTWFVSLFRWKKKALEEKKEETHEEAPSSDIQQAG